MCKERKISGYSKLNKDDLIKILSRKKGGSIYTKITFMDLWEILSVIKPNEIKKMKLIVYESEESEEMEIDSMEIDSIDLNNSSENTPNNNKYKFIRIKCKSIYGTISIAPTNHKKLFITLNNNTIDTIKLEFNSNIGSKIGSIDNNN